MSVAYKRWLDTTGNPDEQAAEFSVSASQAFGQVTPRAQLIYSPDDLGSTSYSIYGEAGIGWKPIRDLMLSANLGRRIRGNALNYASANIGIAYTVHRNFTADLRLFDTNRSNVDEPYKRRLVGSIRAKL